MSKNNKPTKSELAKSKLTKLEVAELIRRGAVSSLRKAMAAGQFEVPGDLIEMNYNNDTAYHIAARYGRVEVLKFLVTELVGKNGQPFCLDPSMTNNELKPVKKLKRRDGADTRGMAVPIAGATTVLKGLLNAGKTIVEIGTRAYDSNKKSLAMVGKALFDIEYDSSQKATAADIAEAYGSNIFEKGERNEAMLEMLRAAGMPAGKDRDGAMERITNHMNIDKFSNEPSYGETIFRQTLQPKQTTELESNAAYYNQIRAAFEDKWQKETEKREEKLIKQRQFFSGVNQGLVGVKELKEYLDEFKNNNPTSEFEEIMRATTAPSIGSKNMLDIAVESGNFEEVKLFVSGIVVGEGENKETLRLDIDDGRALQLLEEALKYNPTSEGHLKIQEFFLQVRESGPPEPSPSQPLEAERLKGKGLVMEMDG